MFQFDYDFETVFVVWIKLLFISSTLRGRFYWPKQIVDEDEKEEEDSSGIEEMESSE